MLPILGSDDNRGQRCYSLAGNIDGGGLDQLKESLYTKETNDLLCKRKTLRAGLRHEQASDCTTQLPKPCANHQSSHLALRTPDRGVEVLVPTVLCLSPKLGIALECYTSGMCWWQICCRPHSDSSVAFHRLLVSQCLEAFQVDSHTQTSRHCSYRIWSPYVPKDSSMLYKHQVYLRQENIPL